LEILEKEEKLFLIRIEGSLDLLFIFHILEKGLANIVLKVGWQDKREEKGKYRRLDRIYINAKLKPLKLYLDERLHSIRITGIVLESEYRDLIGKRLGGDIRIGDKIKLETDEELERIAEKRKEETSIGIIILDLIGYLVAEINSKITILEEKYYPYKEFSESDFKKEVDTLNSLISKMKDKGLIIIAGVNIGNRSIAKKLKNVDILVYGDYNPDISGILGLLKTKEVEGIKNSFYKMIKLYEEIINRDRFDKVVYGISDVFQYIEYGLVNQLIVTRSTILKYPEIIEKLYSLFLSCIEVEIVDDDTSIGMYLNSLGGIAGFKY